MTFSLEYPVTYLPIPLRCWNHTSNGHPKSHFPYLGTSSSSRQYNWAFPDLHQIPPVAWKLSCHFPTCHSEPLSNPSSSSSTAPTIWFPTAHTCPWEQPSALTPFTAIRKPTVLRWTYLQKSNKLMDLENRLVVAKKEWEGLGFGVSRCKRLHVEWISHEILLYSPGNSIWCPVTEHNGRKRMYMDVWLGCFAVQQKVTEYCMSTIIIKKKKNPRSFGP